MIGDFVAFDTRFRALIPDRGHVRVLHNMGSFTEGPVWFGDLQCLLWSDIMANRLMRWTPDGVTSMFRADSRHANGNTRDRHGRPVVLFSNDWERRYAEKENPNHRFIEFG